MEAPKKTLRSQDKTSRYLASMKPGMPGLQEFYQQALTDIPHPLEPGKTLTYGQLQQDLQGKQGNAYLKAYNQGRPTPATRDAYQQAMFDEASTRLRERGKASPQSYAFPQAAMDAYQAAQPTMPEAPAGGKVSDASTEAYRMRVSPRSTAYAAPGQAVSPQATSPAAKPAPTMLAKYRKGTKQVAVGDRETPEPSLQEGEDAGASAPYLSPEDSDPDSAPKLLSAPEQVAQLEVPRTPAKELPASRSAGKRSPKDYQEAAAVIRQDKALYAQYKQGIASGKAFSLTVGGKQFRYAATSKQTSTPVSEAQRNYRKAVQEYPSGTDAYEQYQQGMPQGPTRAAALGKAASDLIDAGQAPPTPPKKRMKSK